MPAAVENVITADNANDVKAKFILRWPMVDAPEADKILLSVEFYPCRMFS